LSEFKEEAMMYLKVVVLALALLLYTGPGTAQTASPSYTCNFAKVTLSSGGPAHVSVRTGAGSKFRQIDKLDRGREVYICDESGDWFKIFYSGPDGPCGGNSEDGLDVGKTKGCRSGWIEKRWIDVISG
jgi:uncharacterized protein YraI